MIESSTTETIFSAALEKAAPAERSDYLAEACAGDEAASLESGSQRETLGEQATVVDPATRVDKRSSVTQVGCVAGEQILDSHSPARVGSVRADRFRRAPPESGLSS